MSFVNTKHDDLHDFTIGEFSTVIIWNIQLKLVYFRI